MLAVAFGRFPGVFILVPGRYLKCFVPGFSFLDFSFLDIASSGSGGFKLTRLLRVVAGWVF